MPSAAAVRVHRPASESAALNRTNSQPAGAVTDGWMEPALHSMKNGSIPPASSSSMIVRHSSVTPLGRVRDPASGPVNATWASRRRCATLRDVSARRGPSDEAWLLDLRNPAKPFEPRLLGIRGDDLEIAHVAEGEERVAGAFAVVGAAGGGANTGGGFDDSDRVHEIAASGDDVIDGEWRRARCYHDVLTRFSHDSHTTCPCLACGEHHNAYHNAYHNAITTTSAGVVRVWRVRH